VDDRTPLVLLVIALAEILFLTVLFRAPIVAVKAALTTLLSVGATLGILVLIFGSGGLGFFVPLTLAAIVFGLSTDYEVFLLARIKEEYLDGGESRASIVRGVVATGRSITLAGITMSVVFFAFALSPLETFTQLGLGMGLAVLLDVTVVRGLLVPAMMALLGSSNWWWPGRVRAVASAQT
jgi:RND superfamily putative drug exporter